MGTPFLSDISFTKNPQTLDISEVGVYIDGSWQNPHKKFLKILLSVDLNKIREQYLVGREGCVRTRWTRSTVFSSSMTTTTTK